MLKKMFLGTVFSIYILAGCGDNKDDNNDVQANAVSSVVLNSIVVVSGSSITLHAAVDNPGTPVYKEKGFCYGTSKNPTIGDNNTVVPVGGTGMLFSLTISDLEDAVKYYIRAYIISDAHGTAYSDEVEFENGDVVIKVTDKRDGEIYTAMIFGSAMWMVTDLIYGSTMGIYTWSNAYNTCPAGWRLPNNNDWIALMNLLGTDAGDYFDADRNWWSASDEGGGNAYHWYANTSGRLANNNDIGKDVGLSVRCVRG